jgi:hypothetical protein
VTSDEAEWVRANVWPEWLYWGGRLPDLRCPCEWVPLCERGDHEACRRMAHLPHWETFAKTKPGRVAHLPASFEHPLLLHGGTVCTTAAMVWLADRACHVLCSCPDGCHEAQLDLFGGVA